MAVDKIRWIVISDLDGTLLDHDTYDAAAALPTIRQLKSNRIPVVFNTSKTYAETRLIRQHLEIHDPFIVENGSCIYLPIEQFPDKPSDAYRRDDYWAVVLGKPHEQISRILDEIDTPPAFYTRFSQCTNEQAVELTGLSKADASLATNREFSEPVKWHAGEVELQRFQKQLRAQGLLTLQGGRFIHVMADCGKGRSAQVLLSQYREHFKTIVLGDSENDAEMLLLADISVVVRSPSNDLLNKVLTADIQTQARAPQGWVEAIQSVLPNLE